MQQCKTIKVCC